MSKAKIIMYIFLFCCCQWVPSFANENHLQVQDSIPHKLLYIVQVENKEGREGNDFMIPYIEQKLKNLRYANLDKRLYDSVVSLNIMIKRPNIQASIITSLINTRILSSPVVEGDIQKDSGFTYLKFMQSYDETLIIKINTFNSLLEFQFTLFERAQNRFSIRYATSSSVFVNPDKPHYQLDIINTLNQVFDKANSQPRFTVVSNKAKTGNYLTPEDTLLLEPIIDDRSPEDDRIYFWSQDYKDKVQAHVEPSKKDQRLENLSPGSYTLFFYVSNSINYSRTDTIHFTVYSKPTLTIQRIPGKFLFESRIDRLIIQEYMLGYRNVDGFSAYIARLKANQLSGTNTVLFVKIADKKGEVYVEKQYAFAPQSSPQLEINRSASKIIEDINFMNNPFGSIGANRYSISFIAKSENMQSVEVKRDLNIFQRRPISLVYDAAFSPLPKNQLFDSWLNVALGLDLRVANFLFITALAGTNAANNSFRHFYGNFIANLSFPGIRLEGGPAIFIADDNKTVSLGFKVGYSLFQNGRSKITIADSYYNRGLSDYYSLHCTGDIFFNH